VEAGVQAFHPSRGESTKQAAPLVCFTEPIAEAGAAGWAAATDPAGDGAVIQDNLHQGGAAGGSAQGIADLCLCHR
jgi:hypothetical protein